MAKITLDGIEIHTEDLNEKTLAEIESLKFVEKQIEKINREINIYAAALEFYIGALEENIKLNNTKEMRD
jgi:hypothetical protein